MVANLNILPVTHEFDETGVKPENRINNEPRTLPATKVRAFTTLYGSFFTESVRIRDSAGNTLNPNQYQFGLFNEIISAKTGKEIAAAVIILDENVPAPVYIDYQCVGGPWAVSNELIIQLFHQLNNDDRPVSWPNILGKPEAYRPAHHFQDIGDLYGAEYFVAAMERLRQAVLMGDNASHDEIWRKLDDTTTRIQQQMHEGFTNLKQYIGNGLDRQKARMDQIETRIENHIADKNNPHNVTTSQLNVYTKLEVDQIRNQVLTNIANDYIRKNSDDELSFRIVSGRLECRIGAVWKIVFPSQWVV